MRSKQKQCKVLSAMVGAVLAGCLLFGGMPVSAKESAPPAVDVSGLRLTPGGMPFGVRFFTDGVLVIGYSEEKAENPARAAGLRIGDLITEVDGTPVGSAEALTERIAACEGKEVRISCKRDGKCVEVRLRPVRSGADGKYRTGVWVRDSGAGIGTVTFVTPGGCAFAGLGHGICDADTGELVPMRYGTVTDVTVSQVVRGLPGAPGEIKGYFGAEKTGGLLSNTPCGVAGIFTQPVSPGEALPVALPEEVHDGVATIRCTLDHNTVGEYTVELSEINRGATGNKCFVIRVTDPTLLAESGGIVQGMSGSPVIQDGKLVGAVTHVLINDPTTGYGVFLTNMLAAMPGVLRPEAKNVA